MKKWKKAIIVGVAGLALFFGSVIPAQSAIKRVNTVYNEDKDHYDMHILITDQIYGHSYADFVEATTVSDSDIKVHFTLEIMSPGGDAVTTHAIVNRIKELKEQGHIIDTRSNGAAFSAGALFWLMGDKRIAHRGDMFMFHQAVINNSRTTYDKTSEWFLKQLDNEMRQELLDVLHDTELVNKLLKEEGNKDESTNQQWFTAQELFMMGLVDEII
jgi:ATP-dependent protease ClpP protease subunit